MKAVKVTAIVVLVYVGIVAVFESFLGTFQPKGASTIVITTTDEDGIAQDRVVSPITDGGHLYVAANHWPRSWYKRAKERGSASHGGWPESGVPGRPRHRLGARPPRD